MKLVIPFSAILLIVLTFSSWAETDSCQHSNQQFNCVQYVKNYDGDTITFNIPNIHPLLGKKISVRVDGIDTAEVRTKDQCEKESARAARKLVNNILKKAQRIDLENISRGKYFRIVADVIVDGKNLKDILISNRLAYAYDGSKKPKMNWCEMGRRPAAQQ